MPLAYQPIVSYGSHMENLHAHVETYSRDCDGGFESHYVVAFNDEEIAERDTANGINDFSDIHFMNRVFSNCCGPYAVSFKMSITVTEAGFEWNEATEEGYRAGEVRWCHDDCDESERGQRDQYAEMMGY